MIPTIVPVMLLAAITQADTPNHHVRVATFNIWELGADKLRAVAEDGRGAHRQLAQAAEIVQRVRPDILLINEIDFDVEKRQNAALFRDRYLKIPQNGREPIDYPYVYFDEVNTGVPTGADMDNDGRSDGPGDAQGYGRYPGQYGMALLSRFEIAADHVRTFRKLLWKDMPDNLMPHGGDNGSPAWYSPEEVAVQRLSSKSHWDVPVKIGDTVIHLLCSHPTPPVFDGDEDRNGRRNHDEIRLWVDYISGGPRAEYLLDDSGKRGGLPPEASFVILGDLNADPARPHMQDRKAAIAELLKHPRVQDPKPTSKGAKGEPANQFGAPSSLNTCYFGRVDYVLPSADLKVAGSGVFWPPKGDELHHLVSRRESSSDHRLVWVDLVLPKNK